MTSSTLVAGSALLAFGPSASLLFILAYQKAQLIIVVTTSAFAFLLSALMASMVWWIFNVLGINSAILIILPSVFFSFMMRCGFVMLYHRVETVIEESIERHTQQQEQNNNDDTTEDVEWTDSARLRLELNDWSCGLAAGTGFGGMHALLLFGTLLASESGNLGTLYQDSCPGIPSIVVSAFNAFFFTLMDLMWMLLTFYGMRRMARSNKGKLQLWIVVGTHLAASFSTTLTHFRNGCRISLPILGTIVIMTTAYFFLRIARTYLPLEQRTRRAAGLHEA